MRDPNAVPTHGPSPLAPLACSNLFEWAVTVLGPPDTLYEGGFFNAGWWAAGGQLAAATACGLPPPRRRLADLSPGTCWHAPANPLLLPCASFLCGLAHPRACRPAPLSMCRCRCAPAVASHPPLGTPPLCLQCSSSPRTTRSSRLRCASHQRCGECGGHNLSKWRAARCEQRHRRGAGRAACLHSCMRLPIIQQPPPPPRCPRLPAGTPTSSPTARCASPSCTPRGWIHTTRRKARRTGGAPSTRCEARGRGGGGGRRRAGGGGRASHWQRGVGGGVMNACACAGWQRGGWRSADKPGRRPHAAAASVAPVCPACTCSFLP